MLGLQLERLASGDMESRLGFSNLILLFAYAGLMGIAQIIFANAAKEINQLIPLRGLLFSVFSSYWLWFGLFIYAIATVFWLYMLTRVDIRFAYPIASTAVIFASLFQSFHTKSFPSFTYWIGLFTVLLGLSLINRG